MSSVYYFKFEEKHEDSSYVTIIGKEFQVFWMSYDFTSLWLYKQTSTSTSLHTHGEVKLLLSMRGTELSFCSVCAEPR
jgi:hypothetical protein